MAAFAAQNWFLCCDLQHLSCRHKPYEVFINQETDPYVIEVNGTLDLAALQLQPATVVINGKKGLVDVQTSKTKRTFADIQDKVLHDATAGSMANPLHISGASLAGFHPASSLQRCKLVLF
ncbi:TPA: hypothetical protein ACH3X3_010222 [Trebouxia sp. C0006]